MGAPIVADLNGDGLPVIVVLGQFGIVLIWAGGMNFQTPLWALGLGLQPLVAQVGDFHGQSPDAGRPEIIVADGSGAVLTILNVTQQGGVMRP